MMFSFRKNVLLGALLLLVCTIIIIYTIVISYDNYHRNNIEDDYYLLQQQIVLNDLYNLYLEDTNNHQCDILNNQLNALSNIQNELLGRLNKINNQGVVYSDNKIKYTYILTNVRLWLHYNKIKKECGVDRDAILYFYPEIKNQTVEKIHKDVVTQIFQEKLDLLKNDCNYNVIALPYLQDIPIVRQIVQDYNIVDSPAIELNGKVYYDIPSEADSNKEFLKEIGCAK